MHVIKVTSLIALTSTLLMACSSAPANAKWMSNSKATIAGKHLNQVTIPGSHYSNAYGILASKQLIVCSGETLPNSLSNNAKVAALVNQNSNFKPKDFLDYLNTQKTDINTQLNNGIRYLELEICLQNATYYTANYYLTDPLDKVMQQVLDFLNDNSKEIVFIDLDNNLRAEYGYMNNNDLNNLHNLLQIQFGSYLTPKQGWQELTIKDIWKTKHRIILLSSNPILTKYYDVWDKANWVAEPEAASYTTIKKLTNIQQFLESNSQTQDSNKLSIIPIYSVFNPDSNTLSELHSNPNDYLVMDYLYTLPQTTALNIIVSDHQYNHQLVNFVLQKNNYIATVKKSAASNEE